MSTQDTKRIIDALANANTERARSVAAAICDREAKDGAVSNRRYCETTARRLRSLPTGFVALSNTLKETLFFEEAESFDDALYYISPRERKVVNDILLMQQRSELLLSVGIKYRNAAIFYGPSGCGKTELARAIAKQTNRTLCVVNLSNLIGSLLGETSKNIAKIFSGVEQAGDRVVLFLDELEAITPIRRMMDRGSGDKEIGRATMSMMQQLDHLSPQVILLAATNRMDALDEATLRRFTIHHEFLPLTADERFAMERQYLTEIQSRNGFPLTWDDGELREVAERQAKEGTANAGCIEYLIRRIAAMLDDGTGKLDFSDYIGGHAGKDG